MDGQDIAVVGIAALAVLFLAYKMWPRSLRPDVPAQRLVRKKKKS